MRALHYFNFLGVLVLAAICVFQWQINRRLNLHANKLDKVRLEQISQIEDQQKQIHGQAADLDAFRERFQQARADLKSAESNLVVSRREALELTSQRDQLKERIQDWARAVAERDEQLTRASEQLQKIGNERNDAVKRFNELAAKHNEIVEALNERTREFNSLVERYNVLAKSSSQKSN